LKIHEYNSIFRRSFLLHHIISEGTLPQLFNLYIYILNKVEFFGNKITLLCKFSNLISWFQLPTCSTFFFQSHVIYIHLFVFIGCMIGLTLFVGVVIANYKENKGTALLTVDQRRWLDLKGRIKLTQPLHIPPRPSMSMSSFRLSAILVLANSALLFFPVNLGVPTRYKVQIVLAVIFTLTFTIECIMKIIALTFNGYWQSKRNRFDMLVSILGLGWIIMHFSMRPTPVRFYCWLFPYFLSSIVSYCILTL
uniref:Ion_trans domain-containing protein n=1 Tax=Schistocephalus solidus TaxID=70667 RepID=A0A183SIY0_SCHSO